MTLSDLTDPTAVLRAVAECDRLGRDEFLNKYGFGRARTYYLLVNDRQYDSKAIIGVAYGYQFPAEGPLDAHAFSGGRSTVHKKLTELGFEMRVE